MPTVTFLSFDRPGPGDETPTGGVPHDRYQPWLSIGLAFRTTVLARVYRRYECFWGFWILHLLLGVAEFAAGLGGYFHRPPRP